MNRDYFRRSSPAGIPSVPFSCRFLCSSEWAVEWGWREPTPVLIWEEVLSGFCLEGGIAAGIFPYGLYPAETLSCIATFLTLFFFFFYHERMWNFVRCFICGN